MREQGVDFVVGQIETRHRRIELGAIGREALT
jgi:hypothetical protein